MRTDGSFHGSVSLAPVRAKVLKQCVLCLLLPLQGVAWRYGLPRASLRLPWAEEAIGLSARLVNSAIRQSHAARILSHAERNASVEIGEICGRHYAPMALKNWRVICFPTDRTDRHRRETPSVFV